MTLVEFILSEAGHSSGDNDCRPIEIQREANTQRNLERMSHFLTCEDRSFTSGNDDTEEAPLLPYL